MQFWCAMQQSVPNQQISPELRSPFHVFFYLLFPPTSGSSGVAAVGVSAPQKFWFVKNLSKITNCLDKLFGSLLYRRKHVKYV